MKEYIKALITSHEELKKILKEAVLRICEYNGDYIFLIDKCRIADYWFWDEDTINIKIEIVYDPLDSIKVKKRVFEMPFRAVYDWEGWLKEQENQNK